MDRWQLRAPAGNKPGLFQGIDPQTGRLVAIKTLPDGLHGMERQAAILRLRREAVIAGQFAHPNILPLLDHGESDGIPYLVFDWHAGETVRELLRRAAPLATAVTITMMGHLLAGIRQIHAKGYIHGDLKPANLLVTTGNGILITDFGAARPAGLHSPVPGRVNGTHGYMPPEQIMGQVLDPRADLFAIGVICHELLTGDKPFRAADAEGMTEAILTQEPEFGVALLPEVVTILKKALARRPRDRYASAEAFWNALDTLRSFASGNL
ncbi:MAG: serine/threonine protein kinase [Magnetococcales bacterium]|nr:serine/threonine protein kinase [Magnetococcales bacterium]